jgi:hypothetical protein
MLDRNDIDMETARRAYWKLNGMRWACVLAIAVSTWFLLMLATNMLLAVLAIVTVNLASWVLGIIAASEAAARRIEKRREEAEDA